MTVTTRHTWHQYLIKAEHGLFRGCREIEYRFYWQFWKPLECIGGTVRFGLYVQTNDDEQMPNRSELPPPPPPRENMSPAERSTYGIPWPFWRPEPDLHPLAKQIVDLVKERDELKSIVDQLTATFAVNFGPEGRKHRGISIDTTRSLLHQLVQVCDAYEKLITSDAALTIRNDR